MSLRKKILFDKFIAANMENKLKDLIIMLSYLTSRYPTSSKADALIKDIFAIIAHDSVPFGETEISKYPRPLQLLLHICSNMFLRRNLAKNAKTTHSYGNYRRDL